ncbi:50S ribosomal protein L30 [Sulfidibacter corallicola]|uniref:Large ribosomal subunit protein uL30 n=1 Tax=Sulfidibacter corallicola TaxID=2818388 RepID=A0A8A4TE84_SULCO|nr:50S ribosomal protein L30 [Sulfidibacter corallicola]QTD47867.1 50S ribosomal protein L30 [Sulfidibacter corallicola]
MSTVKVRLVKGLAGKLKTHRKVVHSLGLKKVNQVKELKDCPEVRGQIKKIDYLLEIVE